MTGPTIVPKIGGMGEVTPPVEPQPEQEPIPESPTPEVSE